jgi:CASC3/Barentsz eIF4AIII binding
MSRERKQTTRLAQSRRQNQLEDDDVDNETGPAIIDDSASDVNSDDDLQLSGSDNDDDDDEEEDGPPKKTRDPSKDSIPTSESYDRLEDDTLQGNDFVDLAASNTSVGPDNLTDTAIIMNGFKDIPVEEEETTSMQFDELDDSINLEAQPSDSKTTPESSTHLPPSTSKRGGLRGRPDRETYWQRRNRAKEEYKKRLEDPTFTPYVGEFFMHDSRKERPFDSLNHRGGRGRGRVFRGRVYRDSPARNDQPQEDAWGHDGFEELEPRQKGTSKVCLYLFCLIAGKT